MTCDLRFVPTSQIAHNDLERAFLFVSALFTYEQKHIADKASAPLLLIYLHEVWVRVTYDWLWPCAYVNPVFTSQSCDKSISTSTRSTNLSVFLVLMLRLMSTQFSLAYTCACAYAYVLVKTRLKGGVTQDDSQRRLLAQHRVAIAGTML